MTQANQEFGRRSCEEILNFIWVMGQYFVEMQMRSDGCNSRSPTSHGYLTTKWFFHRHAMIDAPDAEKYLEETMRQCREQ